jgi:hypothetical protein
VSSWNPVLIESLLCQAALAEFKASAASYGVALPLSQQILEYEVALQLGLGYQASSMQSQALC